MVLGPTAVGKTDKAIELAKERGCEIISCDSRQIYKELDIGVAKPVNSELESVRHHFISHVSIHQPYDAGSFAKEGRQKINELFERYDDIVVCGGTGLYARALIRGLDSLPSKDEQLRMELEELLNEKGVEFLAERLQTIDPSKAESVDLKNPQRLIRAIEIASQKDYQANELPEIEFDYELETIVMNMDREMLYDRINKRVDRMIEKGLEEEARLLYPHHALNALQTVGYKEWWPYFEGEYDKSNAIEKIKQHTRNYAKRQLTWFRHQVI